MAPDYQAKTVYFNAKVGLPLYPHHDRLVRGHGRAERAADAAEIFVLPEIVNAQRRVVCKAELVPRHRNRRGASPSITAAGSGLSIACVRTAAMSIGSGARSSSS